MDATSSAATHRSTALLSRRAALRTIGATAVGGLFALSHIPVIPRTSSSVPQHLTRNLPQVHAQAAGAPSITGLQGTVAHGQTASITGQWFGTGSARLFEDFWTRDFRNWSIHNASEQPVRIETAAPRTPIPGDAYMRRTNVSLGNIFIDAGNHSEYYSSYYMRLSDGFDINADPSGTKQFKIARLWSDNNKINLYPAIGHSDGFHFNIEYVSPQVMRYQLQLDSIPDRPVGWHKMSIYYKKNRYPNSKDGKCLIWWDNRLVFDWLTHFQSPDNNPDYAPGYPITGDFDVDDADLAGAWTVGDYFSSASASTWVDFDDIYLSHTLARVELGNRSSYDQCTILEHQIPTSWTDTSITFKVNQGALSSSGPYLYVTNAQGQTNPQGWPVGASQSTTPTATATPTAAASATATPPAAFAWPTVSQGQTNETVGTIQFLLLHHQYSIIVDNYFGPKTTDIVRRFQADRGLYVDGIVGSQTWGALIVTVGLGSTGNAVRAVQRQLIVRNYAIAFDGSYGPQSEGAMRTFEQSVGLPINGVVESDSWRALVSDAGRPASTPTPIASPTVTATATRTPTPTATATPTRTPTPAIPVGQWRGEYWNNTSLSGPSVLTRTDPSLSFTWAYGSPGGGVNSDNWSARWQGRFSFQARSYTFKVVSNDGVRAWLDGSLIIDQWQTRSTHEQFQVSRSVSAGYHDLRVEYFDQQGSAVCQFSWS